MNFLVSTVSKNYFKKMGPWATNPRPLLSAGVAKRLSRQLPGVFKNIRLGLFSGHVATVVSYYNFCPHSI